MCVVRNGLHRETKRKLKFKTVKKIISNHKKHSKKHQTMLIFKIQASNLNVQLEL